MIVFSVLIPTIFERADKFRNLYSELLSQVGGRRDVELLWIGDNRLMSIGEKRNKLLALARGKYCAFVDDDDFVASSYIRDLAYVAKNHNVDVICFQQSAKWNQYKSIVDFGINYPPNGEFRPGEVTRRYPWHVCAWRTDLAKRAIFEHCNIGEDYAWVRQIYGLARSEVRIPKILHYYEHHDEKTFAR